MDRHPQQIKRTRQDRVRQKRNTANLSALKSAVKNVLQSTDKAEAEKLYTRAVSTLDKLVGKHLIHKNTAARRKSQITRHLNSLS